MYSSFTSRVRQTRAAAKPQIFLVHLLEGPLHASGSKVVHGGSRLPSTQARDDPDDSTMPDVADRIEFKPRGKTQTALPSPNPAADRINQGQKALGTIDSAELTEEPPAEV